MNRFVLVLLGISAIAVFVMLYQSKQETKQLSRYVAQLADHNAKLVDKMNGKLKVSQVSEEPNNCLPDHGYPISGTPLRFYTKAKDDFHTDWRREGILISKNLPENTILELHRKSIPPFTKDSNQYMATDNFKHNQIYLDEYDGTELKNKQVITVKGFGDFEVVLDKNYFFSSMI